MSGDLPSPSRAVSPEQGFASWQPDAIAALLLPAWDAFLTLVETVDLDAPSRTPDRSARAVCVLLGAWGGSRSLERVRVEAREGGHDGTFDRQAHDEALLAARGAAPREAVLDALRAARAEVADYLASDEPADVGHRPVRSVLGPLPLTTLVTGGAYELALHALDLEPAGAGRLPPALASAGLAALVDTTGALASRTGLTASAGCLAPTAGWAVSCTPVGWTTLALPAGPDGMITPGPWPAVEGAAADLLDASAGRRAVGPMLARRTLRLHHASGLLALAPLVGSVPGLPGGAALGAAVANARRVSRLVRRLPGLPR